MIKTGAAAPALFFTLATFASGSLAVADAPAPKVAAPATAKMGASPAAPGAGPAKAGATAAGPAAPAKPVAPAVPAMPKPSRELESFMKGFEGSWKCDTKLGSGTTAPGATEVTAKAAVKIRKEFEGFSWHGEYKLAKTDTLPAMSGVFQVGFDPAGKQATFVSYDSMGAAMMGAGPIAGDSVTFTEEGFMLGIRAKVRETMTKKGPKEIFHKVEIDHGKGYQVVAEDTCKKDK